jgi:very-short-patch-repair endonuclease
MGSRTGKGCCVNQIGNQFFNQFTLGDKERLMSTVVIAVLVVLAIAILIAIARLMPRSGSDDTEWPFYAKKPLSVPEQILYFRLSEALPEHIVLAQVGLSRLLGVKKGNNFHAWNNRINRMSADFVVCAKDSTILAVVELDDSSHNRADRRVADAKKDKALLAAGIRVLRWQAKSLPDGASIRAELVAQPAAPGDASALRPPRP